MTVHSFAQASPDAASLRLLQAYALQQDLHFDEQRPQASVVMRVDRRYKVVMYALREGGIAISSRLRALPQHGGMRDEIILRAARLALAMMREHASTCVISEDGQELRLLQITRASSPDDIDNAVGSFVNALAFWSPVAKKL